MDPHPPLQNHTDSESVAGDFAWTLRPQRIILSAVTLLLVLLGSSSGDVRLAADTSVAIGATAVVNLVWNVMALYGADPARLWRGAPLLQILIDIALALTALVVVDAQSTPLAWMLLLVPVIDAATHFGIRIAVLVWVGVSGVYMVTLFSLSPADTAHSELLRTAVQQIAAVIGVAIPVTIITARFRRRYEATDQARRLAEDQRRELAVVSSAAQQMSSAANPADILEVAAATTLQLGFERADLNDHSNGRWRLVHSAGGVAFQVLSQDPMLDRSLKRASTVSVGVSQSTEADLQNVHDVGYEAVVTAVASSGDGRWIGLRAYGSRPYGNDSSRVESLNSLIAHTAAALRNANVTGALVKWSEQLRHQANHDELTGLPNRAHLMSVLEGGQGSALLFLDLDGFKQINDTMGHEAGDLVLRVASARLRSIVQAPDFAARLGGDEFVIVANGRDGGGLQALAAAAQRIISEPIDAPSGRIQVSASIGIAESNGDDALSLLRRADAAMYEEKRRRHRLAGATENAVNH